MSEPHNMRFSTGFYAYYKPGTRTYTHETITEVGILQALSLYIFENKLNKSGSEISAVDNFYSKDANSETEMIRALYEVIQSIADTQVQKREVAYVHCHADQIILAHNHVIACRDKLITFRENIKELRKLLGECLYTIQSFYSNTNWVEMFGTVPYLDFGIRGKQLMAVAAFEEDTCRDMQDINFNCTKNIIVNDKLTSGYYHGRGNNKPKRQQSANIGKCSHGGPGDESRKMIAKCGINKETDLERLSPHYHLHFRAYLAAMEATKHFLVGAGTGIIHLVGHDIFDSLFNVKVKQDVSLAFAIDTTGSMAEEISAVKETAIQLVTSTIGSVNEPADYVLAMFNDPASKTEVYVFKDGYEMIDKMKTINIDGGGDCPEFAADGILQAVKLSRKGSTLFVFTDADAKDKDKRPDVERIAVAKGIRITTMLTGQCSRRKRSGHALKRRDTLSFFKTLAKVTGGTVHQTNKANIAQVVEEVIEDVFPSAEVIIDGFKWPAFAHDTREFVVDSTTTVLKISLFGLASADGINLFHPDGTMEMFARKAATKLYTSKKEVIISLQDLSSGTYLLQRAIPVELIVNITAQSTIKIDFQIFKQMDNSSYITLTGNPIAGKNYKYFINVFNLGDNGTCDEFFVTDTQGYVMASYKTIQTSTTLGVRCTTELVTPITVYQLKINGTDPNGQEYVRKLSTTFHPTNVEIHILSIDDVVFGKDNIVYYNVVYTGTSNEKYSVSISDDQSFSMAPRRHTIYTGENTNGSFVLKPTRLSIILTFTISVGPESSSQVTQQISQTVAVTNIERPKCKLIVVNGSCEDIVLTASNCQIFKWTAEAEVLFEGTEIYSIDSDSGPSVQIEHANITGVKNGPMNIHISGTCCMLTTILNVVDREGHIAQCPIEFINSLVEIKVDMTISPITNMSTREISTTVDSEVTIAITITAVVFVAIVVISVFIIYRIVTHSSSYLLRTKSDKSNKNTTSKSLSVTYHTVQSVDVDISQGNTQEGE